MLDRPAEPNRDELELTVLLPCLNEAETIAACVGQARGFLATHQVRGEVLVVDNGGVDGSGQLACLAGARVVEVTTRGYGAAVLGGLRAARGRYVITADADGSYDILGLAPFLAALRGGADLVVGNRFRGGIAPGAMPLLHRYLGNPVLSLLGRMVSGLPIGDINCGLRGFRPAAVIDLALTAPGFELCAEMIIAAGQRGWRVVEVATTLGPAGRSRPPHLRTWPDGLRHLRLCLRLMRQRDRRRPARTPRSDPAQRCPCATGSQSTEPAEPIRSIKPIKSVEQNESVDQVASVEPAALLSGPTPPPAAGMHR